MSWRQRSPPSLAAAERIGVEVIMARFVLLPCVVLLALTATLADAQSGSGAVTGRVHDPSEAAIPGAVARLTGLERTEVWTATSDGAGRYRFAPIPVGRYRLAIEATGFAPYTAEFTVAVGQTVDVPIALTLATVSARLDVVGTPSSLDVVRTQVAETIRPAEVDALPLNGRNYLDLATLLPAVSRMSTRSTERFAETSAVPGTGITVQAQRNINNSVIVDGVSSNDDAADLAGTFYSQEVVREFQVVTSGGSAEFGRASAGTINIVTRSGTDQMHGRGYAFFRDDQFDARNPFATRKDPLDQSQYGLSAGGPAGWARSFWFGNFEQSRIDRSLVVTIAADNVTAINDVLAQVGYGGPRVATGEALTTLDTTNLFGRFDHQRPGGNQWSLRYSFYDVSSINARNVGGLNDESRGTGLVNRDQTIAVGYVQTWSSRVVSDWRAAATRSRLAAPVNDLVGPAVNISGVASFGTATFSPTARDIDMLQALWTVTASASTHTVRAGVDAIYNDLLITFPGALQSVYSFPSLANFRVGRYSTFQQAFGVADQAQSNPNLGVFVHDEWRLRTDLTLTAGLRYDLQGIADPIQTDTNNLSPRAGIAWAPGDRRTILRASGGLYYDRVPLRAVSNALQRDGEKYKVAVLAFGQQGAPAFPTVMPSFPPTLVTAIATMDDDIQNGRSAQINAQVEREIAPRTVLTLGYLGLRGRGLIMSRNINVPTLSAAAAAALGIPNLGRPDPEYANVSNFESIGRSQYDGLTLAVNSRWQNWHMWRLSYTLAKAFDDAGNAFFSSPQDNFDVAADWGPSDNDQRNRLVLSGTLQAVQAGGVRALRGWQLSYIYGYGSALPFNVQTGTDRNNDTNVNDRPIGVGRNSERAWSSSTLDLRLSWRGRAGGPFTIEAIAEAFNILNHTNLRNPNNVFGPGTTPFPSFGQPTAADDPRQIQFGVRLSY
jgi:Carboxypeptidase regulatory-like domain